MLVHTSLPWLDVHKDSRAEEIIDLYLAKNSLISLISPINDLRSGHLSLS